MPKRKTAKQSAAHKKFNEKIQKARKIYAAGGTWKGALKKAFKK